MVAYDKGGGLKLLHKSTGAQSSPGTIRQRVLFGLKTSIVPGKSMPLPWPPKRYAAPPVQDMDEPRTAPGPPPPVAILDQSRLASETTRVSLWTMGAVPTPSPTPPSEPPPTSGASLCNPENWSHPPCTIITPGLGVHAACSDLRKGRLRVQPVGWRFHAVMAPSSEMQSTKPSVMLVLVGHGTLGQSAFGNDGLSPPHDASENGRKISKIRRIKWRISIQTFPLGPPKLRPLPSSRPTRLPGAGKIARGRQKTRRHQRRRREERRCLHPR